MDHLHADVRLLTNIVGDTLPYDKIVPLVEQHRDRLAAHPVGVSRVAAQSPDVEVFRHLVAAFPAVAEHVRTRNDALRIALRLGQSSTVREILLSGWTGRPTTAARMPLVCCRNPEIALLALQVRPDLATSLDRSGRITALHSLVEANPALVTGEVVACMKARGANINAVRLDTGLTPLMQAAEWGDEQVNTTRVLLAAGANAAYADPVTGCTVMCYAAMGAAPTRETLLLLLRHGVSRARPHAAMPPGPIIHALNGAENDSAAYDPRMQSLGLLVWNDAPLSLEDPLLRERLARPEYSRIRDYLCDAQQRKRQRRQLALLALIVACRRRRRPRLFLPPELYALIADEFLDALPVRE